MYRNFDSWSYNLFDFRVAESLIDRDRRLIGNFAGKRSRLIPRRSEAVLVYNEETITIRSRWKSVLIFRNSGILDADIGLPAGFPWNTAGRYKVEMETISYTFSTPRELRRPMLFNDGLFVGEFSVNDQAAGRYVFFERVTDSGSPRSPIFSGPATSLIAKEHESMLLCFVCWMGVLHHS